MIDNKPLVAIKCATYNHEPYIRDCLEGFVMQKTDFPFVAIVHDDASTDGTVAIVKEYAEKYPDIIKPIFETENQYSKPGKPLRKIMNEAVAKTGAKYIAMCEGDDYWTDPLKLQKQVDFMEANPDVGLVYTKAISINPITLEQDIYGNEGSFEHLCLNPSFIPTCTVVIRKSIYYDFLSSQKGDIWPLGDVPCWLYFMRFSKIKILDVTMAIYRILPESASHSSNILKRANFINGAYDCRAYYAKNYHSKSLCKKVITQKTKNLIDLFILYNKYVPLSLLKGLIINNIYSPKLIIMLILVKSKIARNWVRYKRQLN